MTKIDVKIIFDFFKANKLEKSNCIVLERAGSYDQEYNETIYFTTKEDFFKEHCREDIVYIYKENYDNCYYDLEDLEESVVEDFVDFLKTQSISDEQHDLILDYLTLNFDDVCNEYFRKVKVKR